MKNLFEDIRNTQDFEGIMLLSRDGELLYEEFQSTPSPKITDKTFWRLFIRTLKGVREAELVFTRSRLYIRNTDIGYLMVLLGVLAPIPKIRLHCDILLPSLKGSPSGKGLRRALKKVK